MPTMRPPSPSSTHRAYPPCRPGRQRALPPFHQRRGARRRAPQQAGRGRRAAGCAPARARRGAVGRRGHIPCRGRWRGRAAELRRLVGGRHGRRCSGRGAAAPPPLPLRKKKKSLRRGCRAGRSNTESVSRCGMQQRTRAAAPRVPLHCILPAAHMSLMVRGSLASRRPRPAAAAAALPPALLPALLRPAGPAAEGSSKNRSAAAARLPPARRRSCAACCCVTSPQSRLRSSDLRCRGASEAAGVGGGARQRLRAAAAAASGLTSAVIARSPWRLGRRPRWLRIEQRHGVFQASLRLAQELPSPLLGARQDVHQLPDLRHGGGVSTAS